MIRKIIPLTMVASVGLVGSDLKAESQNSESETNDLVAAIHSELNDYAPTASVDADITVEGGVVTLKGFVENLPEKSLVDEVCSKVNGVAAIVNRLEVRETDRSDDAIRYDLDRLFSLNYPSDEEQITTAVNDGVVTLTGAVSTYELSRLAHTMAESVHGVRSVTNLLKAEPLSPPSNDEIRQHIALLLKSDPWIEDELVMVDVTDGIVSLHGAVDSMSEQTRLTDTVRVYGVRDVDASQLEVSPELRPKWRKPHPSLFHSDEELASALTSALKKDPRVPESEIELTVLDGDVTLIGSVPSIGAKAAAESDARAIPGVDSVFSYLAVETDNGIPGEELTLALDAIFQADAQLLGSEIEAEFDEGTVTLSGDVETVYQRRHALQIAAFATGVEKVVSKLRVDWETPKEYVESAPASDD